MTTATIVPSPAMADNGVELSAASSQSATVGQTAQSKSGRKRAETARKDESTGFAMSYQEVADALYREDGIRLSKWQVRNIEQRALRKMRYNFALLALSSEEIADCSERDPKDRREVFAKIVQRLVGTNGLDQRKQTDSSNVGRVLRRQIDCENISSSRPHETEDSVYH